jgi:hypothetical protein
MRQGFIGAAVLASVLSTGCVGSVRDTTTPRSAQEMLLVSTAAQRAVAGYDAAPLKTRKVFLDLGLFDPIDKNYVQSSLRYHLANAGVTIADKADDCDIVMEVRNAALGLWDGDFVLGIPQMPMSAQGSPTVLLPPLYAFRRLSHQGFAKFQLWLYDPKKKAYLGRSQDLWGTSYYNQWWVFGIGPFDGSNDVFPDVDFEELMSISDDNSDQPAEFIDPVTGETTPAPAPVEGEGDTNQPPKDD